MSSSQQVPPIKASTVIRNIGQLVTVAQRPIPGGSGPLQILPYAAIAIYNGRIVWVGSDGEGGPEFQAGGSSESDTGNSGGDDITIVDAQGAVVTPGFVDSHTHLLFAGSRAEEFYQRRAASSYPKPLAQGRGILATVQATREASAENLASLAHTRLDAMASYGTTTVEAKTGYGLDTSSEESHLHIINMLNGSEEGTSRSLQQVHVVPTFLGAHTLPPEYRHTRAAYVDLLVEEMLPAFVGLARFCDVSCEYHTFTLEESRRILTRARELGYLLKVHADQLSASGGARLAAELGATSADHLDYTSDDDLDAMRDAGVVATLLPGCSYMLRSPYPSARRLLDRGLYVALATDFNPGISYCENMQTMMGLAMSMMDMTLEEALTAATINGARALALHQETGSIEVGKRCDLAFWNVTDYREIGYHFGVNQVQFVLTEA